MASGPESGAVRPHPTYVTVTDAAYFLGTVALVNSLRLTGNAGPVVVVDAGLSAPQRERLSAACDVRPARGMGDDVIPLYLKPSVAELGLDGLVVLLDSDMIVTGRLEPLCGPAEGGRLCAFADSDAGRRFDEWRPALGIEAPLREQAYVNTGFLAFRIDRWARTMARWQRLCDEGHDLRPAIPWGADAPELIVSEPFLWGDQDILNAILMSETPADSIHVLPPELVGVPHWPHYAKGAKLVDRRTLRVTENGTPLAVLHYWDHPKPWLPAARSQLAFAAYVESMARLLAADDVAIRLPSSAVPEWLRSGLVGQLSRRWQRRSIASRVRRLLRRD